MTPDLTPGDLKCSACQGTLPLVRSRLERADALADAVEVFNANADGPAGLVRSLHEKILSACRVYRAGPPPAYTDDQGCVLCGPCFWRGASA